MKLIILLCILTVILSADFIRNADQTILDTKTCLMWQDDEEAKTVRKKIWQNAIDYCENLTLAGYSNWRLPNYNELLSIVDYNSSNIDSAFQNIGRITGYWTSTTIASDTNRVWVLSSYDSSQNHKNTSYAHIPYVRCVRSIDD